MVNVDRGAIRTIAKDEKNVRDGMLAHEKNCVAYSLSRCLGVSLNDTVGYFIGSKWISKGSDLENDAAYGRVLEGMGAKLKIDSVPWGDAKRTISALKDGRYFAVNTKSKDRGGDGHAFAIVKSGGWGVAGNNQEVGAKDPRDARPYHSQIHPTHKVSVWGPFRMVKP